MTGPIETERLILKPAGLSHDRAIVPLINNPRVAAMLARVPHPYHPADAQAFLERITGPESAETVFALHRKPDAEFMGMCSYTRGEKPELGYWLGEPFWGKGYASEAVKAVIAHAFTVTGLPLLHSGCQTVNPASRRILEGSGFVFTHEAPMATVYYGSAVPTWFFILTRERWESVSGHSPGAM